MDKEKVKAANQEFSRQEALSMKNNWWKTAIVFCVVFFALNYFLMPLISDEPSNLLNSTIVSVVTALAIGLFHYLYGSYRLKSLQS